MEYCQNIDLPLCFTFVKNPAFQDTNYIYSIYCAREYLDDDLILMHGDLVFENAVFDEIVGSEKSCMAVSTLQALPEKDFKAVVRAGRIEKVGIDFFHEAVCAQPLYKLLQKDWKVWLDEIIRFCEEGEVKCYAEDALNMVSDGCEICPVDIRGQLCSEVDNPDDLAVVRSRLHI